MPFYSVDVSRCTHPHHLKTEDVLADMVIVTCTIALSEKNRHALRHVNPQEVVEPANHGCNSGQCDSFCDGVIPKVPFAKGGDF